MRILALGLTAVLGSFVNGWAQTPDPHTAMPERPSVATHTGTIAPGWVEVEAGLEIDRYDDTSTSGLVSAAVKIGLRRGLQLTVQTPLAKPAGATTGIGDVSVGLKWRIVDHAPVVGDFAIMPSFKFPSGSLDAGRGTDTADASLLVMSSRQLGAVSLDINAGITRRSGDGADAPKQSTVWAVAAGGPVRGRLGWGAEVYGYPATSGPAGADGIVAILAGPTFQVFDWLVLDAAFIAPMTGPQPRAFIVGFTYNVASLKR